MSFDLTKIGLNHSYTPTFSNSSNGSREKRIKKAIQAFFQQVLSSRETSSPSIESLLDSVTVRSYRIKSPPYKITIEELRGLKRSTFEKAFEGLVVKIENENNLNLKPTHYVASKVEEIIKKISKLTALLDGNQIEIISHETLRPSSSLYWNPENWKAKHGSFYRGLIYPQFLNYLSHFFKNRHFSVLEVCGGDGELASQIFQKFGSRLNSYFLLEKNSQACVAARSLLPEDATICEVDITAASFLSLVKEDRFECAIGSGALTHQVLKSKKEALRSLRNIRDVLKPGGILLLSGLTYQLLSREDLELYGFEVFNTIVPKKEKPFIQFYAAQKRLEDDKDPDADLPS